MNKLTAGKHVLQIEFTDGKVTAGFYVKERIKPVTPTYVIPKTGIER